MKVKIKLCELWSYFCMLNKCFVTRGKLCTTRNARYIEWLMYMLSNNLPPPPATRVLVIHTSDIYQQTDSVESEATAESLFLSRDWLWWKRGNSKSINIGCAYWKSLEKIPPLLFLTRPVVWRSHQLCRAYGLVCIFFFKVFFAISWLIGLKFGHIAWIGH